MTLKTYITSLRLRTLFLSISGICLGSGIAASQGLFNGIVFVLALLTAVSLQILSNLANELGDYQKGTDNQQRTGPIRSIQQGDMSEKQLKKMIFQWIGCSAIFGTLLVFFAFDTLFDPLAITMLAVGLAAIISAIFYTVGQHAYGYHGLGDLFVFLFFGIAGTMGSYLLFAHTIDFWVLLPASAIGFLVTAVLNLNNIRDVENDRHCHKNTFVVKIGAQNGKRYHFLLIAAAWLCLLTYNFLKINGFVHCITLLTLPIFVFHVRYVFQHSGRDLDRHFPLLVVSTFLLTLLEVLGMLL